MRDEGRRQCFHKGSFYPFSREEIEVFLGQAESSELIDLGEGRAFGGIVPHAGWVYSGRTAVKTFKALKERAWDFDLVVLFGAVHRMQATPGPGVDFHSSWETPLGEVEVDIDATMALVEANLVYTSPMTHQGEHSLEVQMPMVKYFFGGMKIIPIAMPASDYAHMSGKKIARKLLEIGRKPVCIGSTDLTHYGEAFGFMPGGGGEEGFAWARENDKRILGHMLSMDVEKVVPEARANMNACGAGAAAACISFAMELGASRAVLLEHTDSATVRPDPWGNTYVGYASIVLLG